MNSFCLMLKKIFFFFTFNAHHISLALKSVVHAFSSKTACISGQWCTLFDSFWAYRAFAWSFNGPFSSLYSQLPWRRCWSRLIWLLNSWMQPSIEQMNVCFCCFEACSVPKKRINKIKIVSQKNRKIQIYYINQVQFQLAQLYQKIFEKVYARRTQNGPGDLKRTTIQHV